MNFISCLCGSSYSEIEIMLWILLAFRNMYIACVGTIKSEYALEKAQLTIASGRQNRHRKSFISGVLLRTEHLWESLLVAYPSFIFSFSSLLVVAFFLQETNPLMRRRRQVSTGYRSEAW